MQSALPYIKNAMLVLWFCMFSTILVRWPGVWHLILELMLGITLIGHSAICFYYRIKHNKSIPETKYRDLLLYGVFELMEKKEGKR